MPRGNKTYEDIDGSSALDKLAISEYARRENISVGEAERRLASLIQVLIDCLLQSGFVHLRKLGYFHTAKRKNARFLNHATGLMETIPVISVLRFKPAKSFKQLLNDKTRQKLHERFQKY